MSETKAEKEIKKNNFLKYKGKPLVRSGNTIYYGEPSEPYVIMMIILGEGKVKKLDSSDMVISNKIQVQLLSTDETKSPKDRILNRSERKSLYDAMDIGVIWLDRALRDHK